MRFPDRTTGIGSVIDNYLTYAQEVEDRAIHLLFSANRWEQEREIRSRLASGTHVIIDRYAYSGVAFSGAKPGLSLAWCKQPDVGLPRPDLVIFLDVSEEVAKQRGGFGEERYEVAEFQRRVRKNYNLLRDSSWVEVSADGSLDEVATALVKLVEEEVEKTRGNLGGLWQDGGGESNLCSSE
jgi:dTMP kinase